MERSNHPCSTSIPSWTRQLLGTMQLCSKILFCPSVLGTVFVSLYSRDYSWSERFQKMVCEISLKQSNFPTTSPTPKMLKPTRGLSQHSKGGLIFSWLFMKATALRLLLQSTVLFAKNWIKRHRETPFCRSSSTVLFAWEDPICIIKTL